MAPRPFYVKFTPSVSADVVAYKIYVEETPNPIHAGSLNAQIDPPFTMEDDKIKVDLQPLFPDLDGNYTIGVTAIDDAGNESAALEGVTTVDFLVPDAPTNIEFVSG